LFNKRYLAISILVILILGFVGVRYNTIYSGADEGAHFDYINYIIDNKKLPTMENNINETQLEIPQSNPNTIPRHAQHEAVQPPLYYITAAIIGGFFPDTFTRLMVLRFFGVLLLGFSFYVSHLTFNILLKEKKLDDNHLLYSVVSLLFITSPYFLGIMIPLNNEHLLLVLVSTLIFLLTKYFYQESLDLRQLLILSLLVGAIILTKFTAAYLFGIVVAFLLYRRKYKYIFWFSGIVFLLLSPWIYFNYSHYHAFTGIQQHIDIVSPIVNPSGVKYSLVDILKGLPAFFSNMWFWQTNNPIIKTFYLFNTVLLVLSVLFAPFVSIKRPVFFIFTFSLAGNFFMLMYATLTTPIYSIHGRYMYMNYVPFVILTYTLITQLLNKNLQKVIILIIILSILLFNLSYIKVMIPFIRTII
jgi:hypothetical protein